MVDYCRVGDQFYENILNFEVENFIPHVSDHAQISVKLHAKFDCNAIDKNVLFDLPVSWQWKEMSSYEFKLAFMSQDVKQMLDSFQNAPLENVDQMTKQLNDIIYKLCDRSLRKKSASKKSKRVCLQKWFDGDLSVMRK